MIVKENNEITVKVTCSKDTLLSILKQKGFTSGRTFLLDDYYFIPNEINIENLTTREIISKCIIIRNIFENNLYHKKITYKIKEFADSGDIINLEIPLETNNFFVKKAEIELNKILNRCT